MTSRMGRPRVYTEEVIREEADALLEWIKRDDALFLKTFCVERGYTSRRMAEWAHECSYFRGVYEIAKEWQEQKLVIKGLNKSHDSGMTKFVLVNHHGYSTDKSDSDQSNKASNVLTIRLEDVMDKSTPLVQEKKDS